MSKYMKRVRRDFEDVLDDAGDAYEAVRDKVGRRAEKAWNRRGDYADELVSYGEIAADALTRRFRSDPLGTLAVGAVLLWLAGRLARR